MRRRKIGTKEMVTDGEGHVLLPAQNSGLQTALTTGFNFQPETRQTTRQRNRHRGRARDRTLNSVLQWLDQPACRLNLYLPESFQPRYFKLTETNCIHNMLYLITYCNNITKQLSGTNLEKTWQHKMFKCRHPKALR